MNQPFLGHLRFPRLLLSAALVLVATVLCAFDGSGPKREQALNIDIPTLGAHALVFQRIDGGLSTVKTPPLSTSKTGSTLLVGVGRGRLDAFVPPRDNLNPSPFKQIGTAHSYHYWANSGTALYALQNAIGGEGQVISTSTPPSDEVTLATVEVRGSKIVDAVWNEEIVPSSFWRLRRWLFKSNSTTSKSVTTSGPATLVAFWWGDAGEGGQKTAVPNNGFQVIDSVLDEGALVQCAVAVKYVDKAGTYDVTWKATPLQGAQMWLVAVQN